MTMVPVESKAMTSPNVRENIGFDYALKALGSPEHAEFHAHAQRTVSSVSDDGVVEDALGDWHDGAENSLSIGGTMDMEAVRYVAAKQGLRGNQKQVAVFNRDPNGPDILWVLRTGSVYTLAEIRTALTRTGVEHRTLVPTRDGTRVEVLDRGTRATEKIKSVATHCGWHIAHHAGWAEFIGAQTREAAQPIYQLIVDDYEEKYGIASAKAPNFDYKARESTRKLSGLHLQLNQVG